MRRKHSTFHAACWATLTLIAGICACEEQRPLPTKTSPIPPEPTHPTRASEQAVSVFHPDDWFEDVTQRTGVTFTYQNGQAAGHYYILESLGGGVAMIDFDQDGDLDLFFTGGGSFTKSPVQIRGQRPAMYRNDGNWKFVDVTREAGFDQPVGYSHGCSVTDYDRDGYPDLFVCGYGRSRLFRNSGDGRFVDVTDAIGLSIDGWCTASAWADVDRDGWPDLYVARYLEWTPGIDKPCTNNDGVRDVCGPRSYPSATDRLFRNQGDGTFEDISKQAGITQRGNGLGVVATDFNADGWIDFYIANDESDNRLYIGRPNGTFAERALLSGVATNEFGTHDGSMGVDAGDYDGDGRPDIWITNFESEDNGLYHNDGGATFTPKTFVAGLAGHSRLSVGFGTAMADFDGDGWLDIFVTNGHVFYHGGQSPYRQRSQLFRNTGGRRFEDVSVGGGTYFRSDHVGRGAAVGDLDNDGALDIVVVHQNEPVRLLRNRKSSGPFVRITLRGTTCDPAAIGAAVTARYRNRQLVRWIRSGAGYFSQFDQRLLFPAKTETLIDARVDWPGGQPELFRDLATGKTHELIQGKGELHESK